MKKRNNLSITYLLLRWRYFVLIYIYKVILVKYIRNRRSENERGSDKAMGHMLSKSQGGNYEFAR
jgi:hypothetical protein